MAVVLPDDAHEGDAGHVADHNVLRDAIAELRGSDATQLVRGDISGGTGITIVPGTGNSLQIVGSTIAHTHPTYETTMTNLQSQITALDARLQAAETGVAAFYQHLIDPNPHSMSLDSLTDVSVSGAAPTNALVYNGSVWAPGTTTTGSTVTNWFEAHLGTGVTANSTYYPISTRIENTDTVRLRGRANCASFASGATLFTIVTDHRPAKEISVLGVVTVGSTDATDEKIALLIGTDGTVKAQEARTTPVFISVQNISYSVSQGVVVTDGSVGPDDPPLTAGRFYGDPKALGAGKIVIGTNIGPFADTGSGEVSIQAHLDLLDDYNSNVDPKVGAVRIYNLAGGPINPNGVRVTAIANAAAQNRIPVYTFKWDPNGTAGSTYTSASILNGSHNADITSLATTIKGMPVTGTHKLAFWVAPWHEMVNDLPAAEYTAVFNYIINRLRNVEGCYNMVSFFCPTAESINNGTAQAYYPGPTYVDVVGADGYNQYTDILGSTPPTGSGNSAGFKSFRDFYSIFNGVKTFAQTQSPPKPWAIGEYGCKPVEQLSIVQTNWAEASNLPANSDVNLNSKNRTIAQMEVDRLGAPNAIAPGGTKWLIENDCVLFSYWAAGGNTSQAGDNAWAGGTTHWTWRGSNQYASPNNLTAITYNGSLINRASAFVGLCNAGNNANFADIEPSITLVPPGQTDVQPVLKATATAVTPTTQASSLAITIPITNQGQGAPAVGDIAFLYVAVQDNISANTWVHPAGWTLIDASNPAIQLSSIRYWKALTAPDLTGSATVTANPNSGANNQVNILAIFDKNTVTVATPIDAATAWQNDVLAGIPKNTPTTPSTSVQHAKPLVLHGFCQAGSATLPLAQQTITPPSGVTLIATGWAPGTANSLKSSLYYSTEAGTTFPVATSARAFSSNTSNIWLAFQSAIRAAVI